MVSAEKFFMAVLLARTLSTSTAMEAVTSAIYQNTSISCNSFGLNGIYSGYSTNPALQCACITQFVDWYETTAPPTRTLYRTIAEGATTATITTQDSTITTTYANLVTHTFTRTENIPGADGFDWYGSAKPPCCSSCTIAAATVELYYFPTPALKSAPTSFVSNGYTFISPSVYIGFTSLYAYDYCGNVGNSFVSTTLAFNRNEISTVGSPTLSTVTSTWTEYDSANKLITSTPTIVRSVGGPATMINFWDLARNCSAISGYTYLASQPYAISAVKYDPCHPTIILPDRVKSLDPAWATCSNNPIGGFYDPPYVLTAAGPIVQAPSLPPIPSQTVVPVAIKTAEPAFTTPIQTEATASLPTIITSENQGPVTDTPQISQTSSFNDPVDDSTFLEVIPVPSSTEQIFVIGTQTVEAGSAITKSGTVYSLASSGHDVFVDGVHTKPSVGSLITTMVLPTTEEVFVIGTQSIRKGSDATVSGTVYSLASTGGSVYVNGIQTKPSVGSFTTITRPPSEEVFVIGTQSIRQGSDATISGTVYSLAPTGGSIYVNGVHTKPSVGLLTTITQIPDEEVFVIGTQSISRGSAVTLSGTVYSLALNGSVFVNGVQTTPSTRSLYCPTASTSSVSAVQVGATAISRSSSVTSQASAASSIVGTAPPNPGLIQNTANFGSRLQIKCQAVLGIVAGVGAMVVLGLW